MKALLSTLIFLCSFNIINAQMDLIFQYQHPSFTDWDLVVNDFYAGQDDNNAEKIFEHAFAIGAAYRIFPSEVRMGFLPELSFAYALENRKSEFQQGKYVYRQIAFALPFQVFPFDLYGDCNCPTFGKENDFFKRAFFLKFIPEIDYQVLSYTNELNLSHEPDYTNNTAFSLGVGMGLNIALTQLLTLSPEISYHNVFSEKWGGLASLHGLAESLDKTSANNLRFGLRLSFYFNN